MNHIIPPGFIAKELAKRAKARRLELNYRQSSLAKRSGVSEATIKRFEKTGIITLANLIRLSLVLGDVNIFSLFFKEGEAKSIRELEERLTKPKRKYGKK